MAVFKEQDSRGHQGDYHLLELTYWREGGLYIYPDTGVVMAGKVIDYLLSVADEQAALHELEVLDTTRAMDNNHWIDVFDTRDLFEFQFQVLARD